MKRFLFACALVVCAFGLSGCIHVTYGPSDNIADAQFVNSVQAAVGADETITLMNKGYLLANTARPGPAQTWGANGTIVLTDKALYFLFWNRNAKAFDVIRKLPVADIRNASHLSSIFGPGDYISIEDTNGRFDLFTCHEIPVSGDLIERNRKLLESLNALMKAQ